MSSPIGNPSPDAVASQRDAFIERFLGFASGTFSLFSIYIGDRLGLYRALAEGGLATSKELASRTGTVMRADTLRGYAKEAGFSSVEVLPIEHFFFRFYRLTP